MYNQGYIEPIINSFGRFLALDNKTVSFNSPSFARVCIEIDTSNSLPDEVWIATGPQSSFWLKLVYEGRLLFCSKCRLHGHSLESCRKIKQRREEELKIWEARDEFGLPSGKPTCTFLPTDQTQTLPTTANSVQIARLAVSPLEQTTRPAENEKQGWTLVQKRKQKQKAFKRKKIAGARIEYKQKSSPALQTEITQKCKPDTTQQGTYKETHISPAISPRTTATFPAGMVDKSLTVFTNGEDILVPIEKASSDTNGLHSLGANEKDSSGPDGLQSLAPQVHVDQPVCKPQCLDDMKRIIDEYNTMIPDLTISKDDWGIMNKGTIDYMKSILIVNNIDVCAIIEPMAKPDRISTLAKVLNFNNFVHYSPTNTNIWLLWRDSVQGEHKRRKGIFKFIGAWTEHEGFQETVKACWAKKAHTNPLLNCALKLKRLRKVLRKWNWETFGDVNLKVRHLNRRVEQMEKDMQTGNGEVPKGKLTEIKDELASFLRYQYAILEDKAKINWLVEGDRNSNLFHASIKARCTHNKLKLEMDDGSFSEEPDIIGNNAVNYFKDLFGTFPSNYEPGGVRSILPTVSEEQNISLTRIPDEEELRHMDGPQALYSENET
ncbi:hypothetical protein QQ045_026812 [Rhodiola kirilowii]